MREYSITWAYTSTLWIKSLFLAIENLRMNWEISYLLTRPWTLVILVSNSNVHWSPVYFIAGYSVFAHWNPQNLPDYPCICMLWMFHLRPASTLTCRLKATSYQKPKVFKKWLSLCLSISLSTFLLRILREIKIKDAIYKN